MNHRHWFEPTSLSAVVDLTSRLLAHSPHRVHYIHLPIPVSAQQNLPAFLEPLAGVTSVLMADGVEVYLGVIQANDESGTRERIAAVRESCPGLRFGVATECG
jgi:hypothetical protein